MASQNPKVQQVNTSPFAEYMGDVRSVMSPRITGRGELRGVLVPKTSQVKHGMVEGDTAVARTVGMLDAKGQREAVGPRHRITPNTHAVMTVEQAGQNQANGRIIPSSDGVHRDFAGGFAHGRFLV